jgi:hypothetical protein
MVSSVPGIRCRQIDEGDTPAVAELLTRGFPNRNRQFWYHALDQLTRRAPPSDLPKYGYLLETDGVLVGAILLICSTVRIGGTLAPRCNLSSWYVEPAFRAYAPLLVSQALRHKEATYLNVSAAPHTWPIIEAQGFSRYSEGIFVCFPALGAGSKSGKVEVRDGRRSVRAGDARSTCRAWLHQRVVRHGRRQLSIRVSSAHGQRFCAVRTAHLLPRYRRLRPLRRTARPLPRAPRPADRHCRCERTDTGTARHLSPRQQADFRGPQRPRLGDLAYTEYAILGV